MTTMDFFSQAAAGFLLWNCGRIYEAETRKRLNRKNYFLLYSIYQLYKPPSELMTALMATAKISLPPKFYRGLENQNLTIPEVNYLVEFTMRIMKIKLETRKWWQWKQKSEDKLVLYWLETINANHVLAMKF